ncbi:response regulator [Polyangium aurulentum]|uniref:response regulator n=1 Tax=Polyangium aurulentum TaxID=2567896 RepID=UPI00146CA9EA|nr:response regulator [Polyangium aurulentum]UQA55153.1 response regulator [Polyangium aurulentum]
MSVDSWSLWQEESREIALVCDAQGVITWADGRAERHVCARPGVSLSTLAVQGTEEKAMRLLQRGLEDAVRNWELSLVCKGRPTTVSFCARPDGEGRVLLLGHIMPDGIGSVVEQLNGTLNEIVTLNREIMRQSRQLEQQRDELSRTNRELDESNRGVVTLHGEIEEKSENLRRANEIKGRVLAHASHELRTPLHSILGLSQLLLDGADGPLNEEQEKQIRFIRTSAEELSQIVNDVLELSSAEAGKVALRAERFTVADFFSAMRGMLRPLVPAGGPVELVFELPEGDFELDTDQGKVAQVLRNLISNALKFTEKGRILCTGIRRGDDVTFTVADTGIGIAPEHFDKIFEEFGQVENHLQRKFKGTGLGLALSRRLAEMLGGSLGVDSEVGQGSTFTLTIPAQHPEVREIAALASRPLDPTRSPVLIVEDDRKTMFVYEKYLSLAGFQVVPARTTDEARKLLGAVRPAAIVLDIMLEGESSWDFLAEVKQGAQTREIPVLVVTVTNKEQRARALGADEFWLKPVDQEALLRKLKGIARPGATTKVLVIDDDERARYLMRKLLSKTPYQLLEARGGPEGVDIAQRLRPDVIFLDFQLRDAVAFDVLDDLKADPRTRAIPVVIVTSAILDASERERLAAETEAILSKESLSRELAIHRIRDALQKAGLGAASSTE